MLPHVIMFQKRLGYSMKKIKKKRKKEKQKKEDKCPTQNKERFSSPSFPQSFQVSKRGI
jgi:hypothetical protein